MAAINAKQGLEGVGVPCQGGCRESGNAFKGDSAGLTLQGAAAAWLSCLDTTEFPLAATLGGDGLSSSWKQPSIPGIV